MEGRELTAALAALARSEAEMEFWSFEDGNISLRETCRCGGCVN